MSTQKQNYNSHKTFLTSSCLFLPFNYFVLVNYQMTIFQPFCLDPKKEAIFLIDNTNFKKGEEVQSCVNVTSLPWLELARTSNPVEHISG